MERNMSQDLWNAIDEYLTDQVVREDDALRAATRTAVDAGLPQIAVAPNQGKLLCLLARLVGARRILEIGTLAGYSTIWLARGLSKGGRVITLEVDDAHASVARANFKRAKLARAIELRVGQALETLPDLPRLPRFDLVFIDADKANIPEYFAWALKLTRKSGLIIVDNVVREGAILEATSDDASVKGVRRLNEMIARDKRVFATTIQTVGSKGHDGFTVALVL
jgi:predicted O-methyltransferase YrrM